MPEDGLLVLYGRIDLDAGQARELGLLLAGSIDWDQGLRGATRQMISALMYRHLPGLGVPGSVDRALQAVTRAARLQVLRQRAEPVRLLDALIERHGTLLDRSVGVHVDLAGVRQRAAEGAIAGRRVRRLAPEDLALHLAAHLCAVNHFRTGLG